MLEIRDESVRLDRLNKIKHKYNEMYHERYYDEDDNKKMRSQIIDYEKSDIHSNSNRQYNC